MSLLASAVALADADARAGVPQFVDDDGKPVFRILLYGLRWRRFPFSVYEAEDGPVRRWRVERARGDARLWAAALRVVGEPDLEPVGHGYATMREARVACEQAARRLPWVEGAPT